MLDKGNFHTVLYQAQIQYQGVQLIQKMYSHGSQWSECCHHQQEIAILQEKLMQIHNKLIDQLDVCRQQEITIIDLTQRLSHTHNSNQQFDTFNYQSFGHHSHFHNQQENQAPNFPNSINHDSRQSQQTKTDLLQADLEAMRNKVLAQITEKNKLKEDLKELKLNHKKEMNLQIKKAEGIENLLRKQEEELQYLKQRYDRLKSNARSQSQVQRLSQRFAEMESRYTREKQLTKSLQIQKRNLQKKIQEIERHKYRHNIQKEDRSNNLPEVNVNYQQKQIDNLKVQIQKLNKNVEVRQVQFRERGEERRKKRGFQQTKELIKKLQETQMSMRKNRKIAL